MVDAYAPLDPLEYTWQHSHAAPPSFLAASRQPRRTAAKNRGARWTSSGCQPCRCLHGRRYKHSRRHTGESDALRWRGLSHDATIRCACTTMLSLLLSGLPRAERDMDPAEAGKSKRGSLAARGGYAGPLSHRNSHGQPTIVDGRFISLFLLLCLCKGETPDFQRPSLTVPFSAP